MTYAYLRQSPGGKSLTLQQESVLRYALKHGFEIDKEVVEHSSRNRPIDDRKQFEQFMHSLQAGDKLIIDEIWTLSERIDEIMKILGCTMSREIHLHIADQGVDITKETPIGRVLPMLNEERRTEAQRKGGVGRPKGSKSRSKFDAQQPRILQLLKEGMSVSAIARELGVNRSSLKDYNESRSLKELVDNTLVDIGKPTATDIITDEHLFCPFENETTNRNHYKGVN